MRRKSIWITLLLALISLCGCGNRNQTADLPLQTGPTLGAESMNWPDLQTFELVNNRNERYYNSEATLEVTTLSGEQKIYQLQLYVRHPEVRRDMPHSFIFAEKGKTGARMYFLDAVRQVKGIDPVNNLWQVTLANGRQFEANWLATPNLYGHETRGIVWLQAKLMGDIATQDQVKIDIANLRDLTITTTSIKPVMPPDFDSKYWLEEIDRTGREFAAAGNVTLELKSGQQLLAEHGFILDFCGHSSRTAAHTRLLAKAPNLQDGDSYLQFQAAALQGNEIATVQPVTQTEREFIDRDKVKQLTFTGKEVNGAPEVTVTYRNGQTKTAGLFLTYESWGGICGVGGGSSGTDAVAGGLTEDGAWYVPLDSLKSIIYP